MALKQVFPRFDVGEGAYVEEKPIPLVRAGVRVEFRSGGDLGMVVDTISKNLRVDVDAAPGAGKSSRLPLALAKATGALVVHVVPHLPMCVSVYRYMSKIADGVSVVIVKDVEAEWPRTGVVIVPAALVVAKWLSVAKVELPECYVLQDESHESGAASAVMRALTPVCKGVLSHVSMSATHGATGARRMESGGSVEERTYEPSAFADPWSVEEPGAPWAVSEILDHVLIFEDDRRRALSLVEAYNMNGARAYLITSGTTVEEFNGVLDAIEDQRNACPCIVIADSTYRSGHTFSVSLTVDSGLVKRVVVNQEGRPVRSVRPIYESEAVQSKCRIGRLPGQHAVYYRPMAILEKKVCDLEQTDVEAAAVIFRALGFSVPSWARGARMAGGSVPENLWKALSGQMPLATLSPEQLVSPTVFKREVLVEPVAVPERSCVSEVVADYSACVEQEGAFPAVGVLEDPREGENLGYTTGRSGAAVHLQAVSDAVDTVRVVLADQEDQEVSFGRFYAATGLNSSSVSCFAFPEGSDSVLRVLAADGSGTMQYAWSGEVRSVAVNILLNEYNKHMLELHAYTEVLRVVKSTPGGVSFAMRRWITSVAERLSAVANRAEYLLDRARLVAHDFCTIVCCDGIFVDEKNTLVAALTRQYGDVGRVNVDSRYDELTRVKEWRLSMTDSLIEADRRVDPGAAATVSSATGRAVAGRLYTGRGVPGFLAWAAGAPMRIQVAGTSSSSGSSSTLSVRNDGFVRKKGG